jgi:hypothetical protein
LSPREDKGLTGGTAHGLAADLTKDDDACRVVWDTVSHFKALVAGGVG